MRDIAAATTTASAGEIVRPITFVRLDFSSGLLLAHSAIGEISFSGETYSGVGHLGSVDGVSENMETTPAGLKLTLSGIPTELISVALGEDYQGRDARVYLGFVDSDYALVDTPVLMFRGRLDYMDLQIGETATITVVAQNRLADWDRPRVRRYNHEDQQDRFPFDVGFEFVPRMVDVAIVWGRV